MVFFGGGGGNVDFAECVDVVDEVFFGGFLSGYGACHAMIVTLPIRTACSNFVV